MVPQILTVTKWDETTVNGEFVRLGTGITLNMSGGGDVSFTTGGDAPIKSKWGTILLLIGCRNVYD